MAHSRGRAVFTAAAAGGFPLLFVAVKLSYDYSHNQQQNNPDNNGADIMFKKL